MKRSLILAITVIVSLLLCSNTVATNEAKNKPIVDAMMTDAVPSTIVKEEVVAEPVIEEEQMPKYDIPLPNDTIIYIWKHSKTSNLSFALLLALASTESEFKIDAVSKTGDIGLFQIQPNTAKWIASEMGLKKYDLKNAETNIDFAVYYLSYLRDYWQRKDVSEEQLFELVIMSYHRGIEGSKRYIQVHGYNDPYLLKVKENKKKLETNEVTN